MSKIEHWVDTRFSIENAQMLALVRERERERARARAKARVRARETGRQTD